MVFNHVKDAIKIVFSSKKYIALGVGSFAAFLLLYLFTLTTIYTPGRTVIISLRLLNVKLAVFSFVMAFLIALIIPFTVHLFKQGGKIRKPTTAAAGGFIGSILPPLLCCSPLIPSVAALFGAVSPAALGISGAVQGFMATNDTYILLGATLLLLYAVVQTAKSTKQCIC